MMNLKQLINGKKETQEEYFARTYWGGGKDWRNPTVFVYKSKAEKDDPEAKSKPEVIPIEEARRYVETLEPESEEEDDGGDE